MPGDQQTSNRSFRQCPISGEQLNRQQAMATHSKGGSHKSDLQHSPPLPYKPSSRAKKPLDDFASGTTAGASIGCSWDVCGMA